MLCGATQFGSGECKGMTWRERCCCCHTGAALPGAQCFTCRYRLSRPEQDHLLPSEYVHTMREHMLDRCPVSTYEQVERAGAWGGTSCKRVTVC